jgi:hypothetical protein
MARMYKRDKRGRFAPSGSGSQSKMATRLIGAKKRRGERPSSRLYELAASGSRTAFRRMPRSQRTRKRR